MFRYPARLKADEVGFTVTFRDIPEAITASETREEAIEMAADALATAVDFYFEDKRPVPLPSDAKRGETLIELRVSVAAKVLLLNAMLAQRETLGTLVNSWCAQLGSDQQTLPNQGSCRRRTNKRNTERDA